MCTRGTLLTFDPVCWIRGIPWVVVQRLKSQCLGGRHSVFSSHNKLGNWGRVDWGKLRPFCEDRIGAVYCTIAGEMVYEADKLGFIYLFSNGKAWLNEGGISLGNRMECCYYY